MVWLEIIVVLGAIFFGIRQGGIGIGLCGGLGLAIPDSGIWSAYGITASRCDPDYYDRSCGSFSLTGGRWDGLSGTFSQ
ncbi:hypothetical protein WP4S18E07_17840 [Escherichia coli]|nr:hypothetical protein WP4S18E07_17840 [Escherichia coli]